jgi:FkbM family methyltransferase
MDRFPLLAGSYRSLRDLVRFKRSKPISTPHGFKLMGDEIMQAGHYEPTETALMKTLLGQVDSFIDVGAHIGYYTCLARHLGGRVIAVEPCPTNLRYLHANLIANGFEGVEVVPRVLATLTGVTELYGFGGGASIIRGWKSGYPLPSRSVPTTTLDALLSNRLEGDSLLIKIDVEGAEYAVLEGARETLARRPPPIWFVEIYPHRDHAGERNPDFRRTFELFWEHGYEASTARAAARPIESADLDSWETEDHRGPETPNFIFRKEVEIAIPIRTKPR